MSIKKPINQDLARIEKLEKQLIEMILILERPCDLKKLEKIVENWLARAKVTINEN